MLNISEEEFIAATKISHKLLDLTRKEIKELTQDTEKRVELYDLVIAMTVAGMFKMLVDDDKTEKAIGQFIGNLLVLIKNSETTEARNGT